MNSIQPNPCWEILDSSKLDDYLMCPRRYFYRHILGWELDIPAHDLHFGQCWHIAREYQLIHGYDKVLEAYDLFLEEYRKQYDPSTDEIYAPKIPDAVLTALTLFATDYIRDLIDNEVVELNGKKMTEISGTVPISNERHLHYRMDSIMRRKSDGKIFSWDHKTTSAKWIKHRMWRDEFYLCIQTGTYTHCLYCLFPIEEVLGVEYCGTGFEYLSRGSKVRPSGYYCTLQRVPAWKSPDQMNVWLWNANDICRNIEYDLDRLMNFCKESDTVLMAFQQNPKSCTSFIGCQFHDYCMSWQNPLRDCYEPPLGFHTSFWNPSKMDTTNKLNLEM